MNGQIMKSVNDVELACEVAGSGAPVLLIHGLGGSRHDWAPQLPALSNYRVIRYDIRGHGQSSKPKRSYSLPALADDAASLLRALEQGPAHVVGLSLGGMIGFQLAVDHPDLVRSLTIVNSGPEVVGRTAQEKLFLAKRLFLTWALGPRRLSRLLVRRLFPKPEQEPLRRDFVAQMVHNDRHAYLATTRAIIGWSVADRLPEIRCPVLVVSGDRDYTPIASKEAYVRRLPRAELAVIADSGHATPIDRPDEFNQRLVRFLAQA